MKSILILIFVLFCTFLRAQDCKDYISSQYDKMSGESSIRGNDIIIKDGEKIFTLYTIGGKGEVGLYIYSNAPGCVDDKTKTIFLFSDSTRLTVYAENEFNCQWKVLFFLGKKYGNKDLFKSLQSKRVEAIRIYTRQSYEEFNISEKDGNDLMNIIKCLKDL